MGKKELITLETSQSLSYVTPQFLGHAVKSAHTSFPTTSIKMGSFRVDKHVCAKKEEVLAQKAAVLGNLKWT